MFSTADTIVAIATPAGRGAIGIVRLSGPDAQAIACIMRGGGTPLRPRHATFSRIHSADDVVDHAIVTFFPAPHSYTGDDLVEVSAHGSPVVFERLSLPRLRQEHDWRNPVSLRFVHFSTT